MANLPDKPKPMTETQARMVTTRINDATTELWELVVEAHDREAWRALGYGTWAAYLQGELTIGRSEAYRQLTRGQVLRELTAAAGVDLPPDTVSARAAQDIKPVLDEVVSEVRKQVEGVRAGQRPSVVAEVVEESRARDTEVANPLPDKGSEKRRAQSRQVLDATATEVAWPKSIRPSEVGPLLRLLVKVPANKVADALDASQRVNLSRSLRSWLTTFDTPTPKGKRVQEECTHPRSEEKVLQHGTYCRRCGKKVR